MGNRVLRKFGEEHALRICFRDDDMGKMGFPQGEGPAGKPEAFGMIVKCYYTNAESRHCHSELGVTCFPLAFPILNR